MAETKRIPRKPSEATAPIPIEIKPDAQVDEKLFLLRYLETMYGGWPEDFTDLPALEASIGKLRQSAIRYYDYISEKRLDPRLMTLYKDLVDAVEAYAAFVAQLQRISARSQTLQNESGDAAPIVTGDVTTDLIANIVGGIWQARKGAKAAAEFAEHEVNAAASALMTKVSDVLIHARNAAIAMTEDYGWQTGEAGFDLPPEQEESITKLSQEKDLENLLPLLDLIRRRRPRDPFAILVRHATAIGNPHLETAELKLMTQECLRAACLIPKGLMYDEHRSYSLCLAALISVQLADREAKGRLWGAVANPAAAFSLALLDTRERYAPFDADVGGDVRHCRAAALAMMGQFPEALKIASELEQLRQGNASYAMLMSFLMNNLNKTDEAYEWLARAVCECGLLKSRKETDELISDPNLSTTRQTKAKQFEELLQFDCTLTITYGFFNDDISLRNNSRYPITNAKLICSLLADRQPGEPKDLSCTLETSSIGSGEAFNWADCISIPGDKLDAANSFVNVFCDQAEKVTLRFTAKTGITQSANIQA